MTLNFIYFSCDDTQDCLKYSLDSLLRIVGDEVKIFVPYNEVKTCDKNHKQLNWVKVDKSIWREETIEFLERIKGEVNLSIVLLDDFFIRKFDEKELQQEALSFAASLDHYRKLTPYPGSLWWYLKLLKEMLFGVKYIPAPVNYPFKASLHISFWRIPYLLELVKSSEGIWHFETQNTHGNHTCSTKSLIHFTHLVEKGEWQKFAHRELLKAGMDFQRGERKLRNTSLTRIVKDILSKIIRLFFGYSFIVRK